MGRSSNISRSCFLLFGTIFIQLCSFRMVRVGLLFRVCERPHTVFQQWLYKRPFSSSRAGAQALLSPRGCAGPRHQDDSQCPAHSKRARKDILEGDLTFISHCLLCPTPCGQGQLPRLIPAPDINIPSVCKRPRESMKHIVEPFHPPPPPLNIPTTSSEFE